MRCRPTATEAECRVPWSGLEGTASARLVDAFDPVSKRVEASWRKAGGVDALRADRETDPRVIKTPHRLPPGQCHAEMPVLSTAVPLAMTWRQWRLRPLGEVDAPATLTTGRSPQAA